MQFWVNQTFNGVSYAALLFLVGGGLTLIFGVMKIVNVAHGSFYLLGGYLGVALFARTGNFYVALFAAALVVALGGAVLERVFLRAVEGDDLRQMLLTMGIALFVQDACLLVWGGDPFNLRGPAYFSQSVKVAGFTFPILRLFMIGSAGVLFAVLWWFQERTRAGAMVRAAVDNAEMTEALGINVPILRMAVFALGALLAGFAGVVGSAFMGIYPGLDFEILPYAFVVVIVGGMGSLGGALAAALVLGLLDNFGKALFPEISYFTLFAPMGIVLAFRPTGLFGRA
ncbi:MAG: branched-chain amino acid ABC transporter permease [Candidatus Rokubacteria bacterium]|nr:branched-chain amino acid ABC transporter permease [Candidatus Rokubacteria bacterium]